MLFNFNRKTIMSTKKTVLSQIPRDLRREDDNETTKVHIIESDVWYT